MAESDSDQTGIPLIEPLSSDGEIPTKKRKRDIEGAEAKKTKQKRKRAKRKPEDIQDEALDAELGINHAIAHMDARLMADHLSQRTRRFRPELSLVEMEEVTLSESAIKDTSAFDKDRTSDNMADFLLQFAARPTSQAANETGKKGKTNGLEHAPKGKGTPHTLVVAGAGLRAADVTRALRRFQTKESMVAKLFAKHIKLKEATEMVKTTRMGIGVGTPQRLIDLLEDGALSARHLERILVDASHIDQKKRGILDMKETHVPLVQLLTRADLKSRYGPESKQKKIELLFY